MQVDSCGFEAGMSKKNLNRAQVGSGIEQVGGERVAEGLLVLLIVCNQQRSAIVFILSMV